MELKSALAFVEECLERGRKISMSTQYGVGLGTAKELQMRPDGRYLSWKDDVRLFLVNHGFKDDAETFGEADSVPLMTGGYALGDPQSPESLKLMENVRKELSEKLKILRGVRTELEKRNQVNTGVYKALAFDSDKSRLYVRGNEILIRKLTDQYHLLRIVFERPEDVSQEWFFSEIAERVDMYRLGDKRYYNAANEVRRKVAQRGFEDFFITTKQSLKINTKYLS